MTKPMTLEELNEHYKKIEALERQRLIVLRHAREVRELAGYEDNDYRSVYMYAKDHCDGFNDLCTKIVFERYEIEKGLKKAGFDKSLAITLAHTGLPNLKLSYYYGYEGSDGV